MAQLLTESAGTFGGPANAKCRVRSVGKGVAPSALRWQSAGGELEGSKCCPNSRIDAVCIAEFVAVHIVLVKLPVAILTHQQFRVKYY